MKVVIELLIIGILGAAAAGQPLGTVTVSSSDNSNTSTSVPGKADFEREVKTAGEEYERAKLRYDESTERARLIYIKILEDNIGGAFDGGAEVARVYIGDDGFWYLHGSTGRGFLVVRATAVKLNR